MVAPRFRSRRFRRSNVRTPGGSLVVHYDRRKPGRPQCSDCGEYLKGVVRGIPSIVRKLSKTQKRPERPYGGTLCSSCMRKVIIEKTRKLVVQDG
ncbi:50S ribosomal protein L34e [Candidatus Woesearchaeota archaeon]|nr:50S ribosomal protein L34e [Candidatus Woesearchaeota archaeon]